jgi:hypothetical protein
MTAGLRQADANKLLLRPLFPNHPLWKKRKILYQAHLNRTLIPKSMLHPVEGALDSNDSDNSQRIDPAYERMTMTTMMSLLPSCRSRGVQGPHPEALPVTTSVLL